MSLYTFYIYLIIIIKVIFIILALTHIGFKIAGKTGSTTDNTVVYWKNRCEFAFFIMMALLSIYLFNLRNPGPVFIEGETKILYCLFGFILIITADWSTFFSEAKWLYN